MQIFNTMTRKKEDFIPQEPGVYRVYVCGPTVYNYIHIGNARPMIVFDTLRRYLEYVLGQILLAKKMGKKRIIAETGASSISLYISKKARRTAPPCRRLPASSRPSTSKIPRA